MNDTIKLYTTRNSKLDKYVLKNYLIDSGHRYDWDFVTLKLSEVDSWLPIFHRIKDQLHAFYFGFDQYRGPLVQYLGFEVEGPSMDLEHIFLGFKWVGRTKENYLNLQQELLKSYFDIEAGIDPAFIAEIDKIYNDITP